MRRRRPSGVRHRSRLQHARLPLKAAIHDEFWALLRRTRHELPEFGDNVAADASGLVHASARVPFNKDFGHLCRCTLSIPAEALLLKMTFFKVSWEMVSAVAEVAKTQ